MPASVQVGSDVSTAPRYYYVYNGHGDVVALVDANGVAQALYTYDEQTGGFGVSSTTENFTNGWRNPYRYDGRDRVRYDAETGLYWMSVRAYDPTLGRFISRDPLGRLPLFGLSTQPYAYAGNNPLTNVDPSGQRFIDDEGRSTTPMPRRPTAPSTPAPKPTKPASKPAPKHAVATQHPSTHASVAAVASQPQTLQAPLTAEQSCDPGCVLAQKDARDAAGFFQWLVIGLGFGGAVAGWFSSQFKKGGSDPIICTCNGSTVRVSDALTDFALGIAAITGAAQAAANMFSEQASWTDWSRNAIEAFRQRIQLAIGAIGSAAPAALLVIYSKLIQYVPLLALPSGQGLALTWGVGLVGTLGLDGIVNVYIDREEAHVAAAWA